MDGIINVFKPRGITSHDVVGMIRKAFQTKKIGHTGTLDPNATGVLILCINKGTRISEYLLDADKEYIGELSLGLATDTQDEYGQVIGHSDSIVNENDIRIAFDKFKGEIYQIPPMYSAIKYRGKRLYELARDGKIVDREPRKIKIYELDIINIFDKKILFYVKCSKGTYIRTLCDDIGKALGTYGYMSYLIRVGVGDFKISHSYGMDYIRSLDYGDLKNLILPIDKGLVHLNSLKVEDKFFKNLINGVKIPLTKLYAEYNKNESIRIYCQDMFIGIGKVIKINDQYYIKMSKVFV